MRESTHFSKQKAFSTEIREIWRRVFFFFAAGAFAKTPFEPPETTFFYAFFFSQFLAVSAVFLSFPKDAWKAPSFV